MLFLRWEDEIIWDTENMPKEKPLRPKMVSLDPNDDNIFIGMPDDIDPSTLPPDQPIRKVKVIQKHVKKSRMMLNRAGIISVVQDEAPLPQPKGQSINDVTQIFGDFGPPHPFVTHSRNLTVLFFTCWVNPLPPRA